MKKTIVLLSLLAMASVAYVFFMPVPAPLTEHEKTALAEKIEWGGFGNIVTATVPLFELPIKDPFFRIVRVFKGVESESGYYFEEDHFFQIKFRPSKSLNLGDIFREYDLERREKDMQSVILPSDSIDIAVEEKWTNPDTGEVFPHESTPSKSGLLWENIKQ